MIRTLLFHCLLYQKMTDSSEANQHLVNDQFEMKPVQISMPDHLNCTPFSKWILFFSSKKVMLIGCVLVIVIIIAIVLAAEFG